MGELNEGTDARRFRQESFRSLTGLGKVDLVSMINRRHLPFHDYETPGQAWYSYRQAYATRLAVALAGPALPEGYNEEEYLPGAGLARRHACTIVENHIDLFVSTFRQSLLSGEQVFFGYGRFRSPWFSNPIKIDGGLVAGPINQLVRTELAGSLENPIFQFIPLNRNPPLRELTLVDATEELREMKLCGGDHPWVTDWMDQASEG